MRNIIATCYTPWVAGSTTHLFFSGSLVCRLVVAIAVYCLKWNAHGVPAGSLSGFVFRSGVLNTAASSRHGLGSTDLAAGRLCTPLCLLPAFLDASCFNTLVFFKGVWLAFPFLISFCFSIVRDASKKRYATLLGIFYIYMPASYPKTDLDPKDDQQTGSP